MFEPDPHPLELEVLVTPETTLILFAAIVEPLRAANRVTGRQHYRWRVTSIDGGSVQTAAGVPVPVDETFDPSGTRPLLVTGSYNILDHASPKLVRLLAQAGRNRGIIGGVEAGGWLLGLAGLLNGYRATAHWEDLNAFAARFQEVEVVEERVVRDRGRVTTAGSAPTLDLMLELIASRQGPARALDVARLLNYQFSAPGRGTPRQGLRDPAVARATDLMQRHLDDPLSIAQIARLAGLSTRHLQSRFVAALGAAPQAHYMGLRMTEARRLLLEGQHKVLDVAAATGFASPAGFARAYRRWHGERPSETRRQV
ncbi:MAG: helix-turn-helix domain-containing protein [Pseudomonadota bacterium]